MNRQPAKPDYNAPIKHLMHTIDALVNVLDAEPEMLTQRGETGHAELLRQKQRLTVDYTADLKALAVDPDLAKNLPAAARDTLKAATSKLEEAVARNAMALKVAMTATERLVQTIIHAVREEAAPKQTYGNPQAQAAGIAYKANMKPVAVDTKI